MACKKCDDLREDYAKKAEAFIAIHTQLPKTRRHQSDQRSVLLGEKIEDLLKAYTRLDEHGNWIH